METPVIIPREEHLEWCKKRALAYCDIGDINSAFTSMCSDLEKHPETEKHIGCTLGLQMLMAGELNTSNEMAKFIKGFN